MTISIQVPKLPIETSEDHQAVLMRIDALTDAAEGTAEAVELSVFATLCADYESRVFPVDLPSAIGAIRFRMEQGGYTQADLARVLGSRSRASEILTGHAKTLSVNQIRRLNAAWHIPAEVLIREAA